MFPIIDAKKIIWLPLKKAPSGPDIFLTLSPHATAQEKYVFEERAKQLEEERKKRKEEKPPPRVFLVINTQPEAMTPQDVMIFKRNLVNK